jgi:DNA-binding NtrC family response regulator
LRALGEAFERFGYAVASAATAEAALVALAGQAPAVVILDLPVSDAHGAELCERLRRTGGSLLLLACSAAALGRLVSAPRSGHGRPGRNVMERAMSRSHGAASVGSASVSAGGRNGPGGERPHLPRTVAEVARAHIERTLQFHGGNRTRAARELGISRATLINKIKAYGL